MKSNQVQLDWIDAFVARIRPFVHVRLKDRVLIRLPNQAFKLNRTGSRVLNHIIQGGSIKDILKARSYDENLPAQLHCFFTDLSRMLGSTICDAYQSASIEKIPFDLGYIELPILSEIALTWKCNIKCQFCYASCRCISEPEEESTLDELSTKDFKHLLDIIRHDAEVPSVSFTGGEPVLRRDLTELIDYASSKLNMRVNLITNGTLISAQMADDFRAAGLASAQVSIESPDPDIHNHIVGIKNAFEASKKGLQNLKNAGISVHPHATVCRLNAASLTRMARFAKSLGMDRFSMNMIIPAGRGDSEDLAIRYSEVEDIVLGIKSEAEDAGIRFMWYSPTPMCLFNPVSNQLGNKGCSACEGLLSVDSFGRLLPCSSWKESVGNLLVDGFHDLWFGRQGTFLREKQSAHPVCRECEHFAICHGACPLYFKVYGYDELDEAHAKIKTEKSTGARSLP